MVHSRCCLVAQPVRRPAGDPGPADCLPVLDAVVRVPALAPLLHVPITVDLGRAPELAPVNVVDDRASLKLLRHVREGENALVPLADACRALREAGRVLAHAGGAPGALAPLAVLVAAVVADRGRAPEVAVVGVGAGVVLRALVDKGERADVPTSNGGAAHRDAGALGQVVGPWRRRGVRPRRRPCPTFPVKLAPAAANSVVDRPAHLVLPVLGVELVDPAVVPVAVVHDAAGLALAILEGVISAEVVAELVGEDEERVAVASRDDLVDANVVATMADRADIRQAHSAVICAAAREQVRGAFEAQARFLELVQLGAHEVAGAANSIGGRVVRGLDYPELVNLQTDIHLHLVDEGRLVDRILQMGLQVLAVLLPGLRVRNDPQSKFVQLAIAVVAAWEPALARPLLQGQNLVVARHLVHGQVRARDRRQVVGVVDRDAWCVGQAAGQDNSAPLLAAAGQLERAQVLHMVVVGRRPCGPRAEPEVSARGPDLHHVPVALEQARD
mmetsp:Transcript_5055/g.14861  ORF Transcript_5055/g.14861 Transcript_5055/m.14861 type:complete len:502 (+) Transcript_5055:316-1821(+)